jgi:C4-dicarboxylate-specific signal transduction histidine kinase
MNGSKNPEAAFLALMTASATHEVRNVLAIIKESAGLIQDMVLLFEKKGTMDGEKLNRTVGRIDTQIKRGANLLTSLNRLSHTLDFETTTVDLNQEIQELVFLSQRSARKGGHVLEARTLATPSPLAVNQLHLHMALFSILGFLLDALPEGATVAIQVTDSDNATGVELRGLQHGEATPFESDRPEALDEIRVLGQALNARLEQLEDGSGFRVLFPRTTGASSSRP